MSCKAVESGDRFLSSTLSYLDCTGQSLGTAGWQSLSSAPMTSSLLLALLTLFIASIGLRLMFDRPFDLGDLTMAAAKIGFVLMLAFSWPAVQTMVYGTAVQGPRAAVERLDGSGDLAARLQNVDSGIVAATSWGTGKLDIRANRTATGQAASGAFAGEATNESLGYSAGRLLFMTGALIPLGAVMLGSGLLITLLPLFAGFLLFQQTRGLFFGWARGMVFLFFAGIAVPAVLLVQASLAESWLRRVIEERQQDLAAPGAPIELLAIGATFAVLIAAVLWLLGKVCFNADLAVLVRTPLGGERTRHETGESQTRAESAGMGRFTEISRATHLASVLDLASRRESVRTAAPVRGSGSNHTVQQSRGEGEVAGPRIGERGRRALPREAASRQRRDGR